MSEIKKTDNARNAILGVGIAAIAGNAFATGGYGFWDTIVGILLFFVLAEFWRQKMSSVFLELAYAFALSYVLIMVFGPLGDLRFPFNMFDNNIPHSFWEQVLADNGNWPFWRGLAILIFWAVAGTLIFAWRRRK